MNSSNRINMNGWVNSLELEAGAVSWLHASDPESDDEAGRGDEFDDVMGDLDDVMSDLDDDVEVVAVVPPPAVARVEEVWDVQGRSCPICLDEFNNGDSVVVLSCGGGHFLCNRCYGELVRFDNSRGEEECPVCRRVSPVAVVALAQNFYPGRGTADDAIMVE